MCPFLREENWEFIQMSTLHEVITENSYKGIISSLTFEFSILSTIRWGLFFSSRKVPTRHGFIKPSASVSSGLCADSGLRWNAIAEYCDGGCFPRSFFKVSCRLLLYLNTQASLDTWRCPAVVPLTVVLCRDTHLFVYSIERKVFLGHA